MGGKGADSDKATTDQPREANCRRRSQALGERQKATLLSTIRNGSGDGSGWVFRPRSPVCRRFASIIACIKWSVSAHEGMVVPILLFRNDTTILRPFQAPARTGG